MKKNTKKSILQKTIIAITIIITFNFIAPTFSNAGVVSDIASSVGGIIFNAVADLLEVVGDGMLGLIQYFMLGDVANEDEKFKGLIDTKVMVDKDSSEVSEVQGGASDAETMTVSADDLDLGRASNKKNTFQVPIMKYTPEEIFKGKTPFLQVNFINPKPVTDSEDREVEGISQTLHQTIANWYIALRNLSVVGLLSILVYVGIRILISSTASDKAKYKQLFTDWLVALCLVFFLHYIMSFILVMTESITSALANDDKKGSIVISVDGNEDVTGGTYTTNVMGASRFMTQTKDNVARLSYLVIYLILVGYTILFTFTYLKRTLMMAFLTVIAPLVAMTYPIDKMNDGQAQAFNMWLKEFAFNALLQPFHLIIYYVFVMSAVKLATNPIYVIAVMLFILPAEKILRSFFGFDKASKTVGALTGFAAASALSSLGKGGSKGRSGGKGTSGGTESGSEDTPEKPPRMQNDPFSEIEAGGSESSNTSQDSSNQENVRRLSTGEEAGPNGGNDHQEQNGGIKTEENTSTSGNGSIVTPGSGTDAGSNKPDSKTLSPKDQRRMTGGSTTNEKQKRKIKGVMSGLNNVRKRYVRPKKLIHGGLKMAGLAARAASTVAGAGAGAVMGIASGKGLAGAVTGAVAGSRMGANAARGVENFAHGAVDKISEAPKNAVDKFHEVRDTFQGIGDTFKEGTGQQIDYSKRDFRDYQENEANKKYLNDKFYKKNGRYADKNEMKALMQEDQEYVKRGFSDAKEISDLKQAEKAGYSREESAFAAALVKDRYTKKDLSDKNIEQTKEAFAQTIMSKREGITKEQALKKSERILQVARYQNGLGAIQREAPKSTQNNTQKGNNTNKGNNRSRNRSKGKRK